MTIEALTRDRWYDGNLWLTQPATGFRATSDAVMLAASVPDAADILELGVGAGAVLMILARRLMSARLTGVDHDPAMLDLARLNAKENGFADRITLIEADVTAPDFPIQGDSKSSTSSTSSTSSASLASWDHVVMNPPFNDPLSSLSPGQQRRQSMASDYTLPWIGCAARALNRRGGLTMIGRADQLDQILAALAAHDMGETVIRPVHSRADRPAHRVLIRARKGMSGALTLLPPLIMDSAEYADLAHGGVVALVQPGRKYAAPQKAKP